MAALKREKSHQEAQTISKNNRLELMQGLVNLYVVQNSLHGKSEQKQFATLLNAYWAEMPFEMKKECAKKLSARNDVAPELKTVLDEFKSAKPTPVDNKKKVVSNTTEKTKALKAAHKPHIPVWWSQAELFFDMKCDARIKAIADLEFADIPEFKLPSLAENELRDVKNFYFSGNVKEVLDVLQNSLNISQNLFNLAMDDKELIGMCLLLKAIGFNSKDMTSFIIFNAAKLEKPAIDAFVRAKWIDNIPQNVLAKIIELWQNREIILLKSENEPNAKTIKTKPVKSGAVSLQNTIKAELSGVKAKIKSKAEPQKITKTEVKKPQKKMSAAIKPAKTEKLSVEKVQPQKISNKIKSKEKLNADLMQKVQSEIKSKSVKISPNMQHNKAYFMKPIRVSVSYKKY